MPTEPEGLTPVFDEPWQAQAFALVHELHAAGHFSWREWTEALGRELATGSAESSYFGCWLAALEKIVAAKRLVRDEDLTERVGAWRDAHESTPHGHPVTLGAED